MADASVSWRASDNRTELVPVHQERAVSEFWWRHPHLVQVAAIVALVWGAGYLIWRAGWSGAGVPAWLFWPLLCAEAFGWLSLASYAWLAWHTSNTLEHAPAAPANPAIVDVFVTTYDEAVELVEPTLVGCAAIPEPHITYLLDDGRREEMRALAARYGAQYVTRPDNSHAKAGNINHALTVTGGEMILVLDADHVPMPNILSVTLGYFDDPTVALVQTPHEFSNRDSVQHHGARRNEQSLFYDVIAPNKDRANAMFWCGSATVIRRAALLDVGGVLTSTVAEDFHTTIAMHAAGWRTRYHSQPVVQGRAPHDLAAFLLQRARWARGNLAVFRTRENPFWCRGLSFRQRLSYLGSLLHYFSAVQRLTLLGVLVTVLVSGLLPMHANLLTLAALWGPWTVLAFSATLALGRGTISSFDSTRFGLMTMGVQLRGVLALAWPRAGRFKVTPKEGIDEGGLVVLRMLPLLTVGLVAVTGATLARLLTVAGVMTLPALSGLALGVMVALAVWEMCCFLLVLVPLTRRRQLRRRYRLPVRGLARVGGRSATLRVLDLSTHGIALGTPIAIEPGTRMQLRIDLPDATDTIHHVTLPVVVRSCRALEHSDDGPSDVRFHVGTSIEEPGVDDRRWLLEYCAVVHPARALGSEHQPIDARTTATEVSHQGTANASMVRSA